MKTYRATRIEENEGFKQYRICGMGQHDPGQYAVDILGDAPGMWGCLFAYMHRRFGPCDVGDQHKGIGGWYITTPDSRVMLWVKPSPLGMLFSFGYGVPIQTRDETFAKEPLRKAIEGLKTAVYVRDILINALGRLGDTEPVLFGTCAAYEYPEGGAE